MTGLMHLSFRANGAKKRHLFRGALWLISSQATTALKALVAEIAAIRWEVRLAPNAWRLGHRDGLPQGEDKANSHWELADYCRLFGLY